MFLWGTQYKASLYHASPRSLSSGPIAKFISEDKPVVSEETSSRDTDGYIPELVLLALSISFVVLGEFVTVKRKACLMSSAVDGGVYQKAFSSILFFRPPPTPLYLQ